MKAPEIKLRWIVKAIPRRGLAFSENWQSLCRMNAAPASADKLIHANT
jgi:hypothetical protein